MSSTLEEQQLIRSLDLPSCLRARILCRVAPSSKGSNSHKKQVSTNGDETNATTTKSISSAIADNKSNSFVLYLPTVVLRKKHNPGFALACRLANHYRVPLLVLVTVLDDAHLAQTPLSPLCMTSRRLAFVLEALQGSCCPEWENHGAGVAIRVHGPGCRTPHHQSLAHAATAVVSDEPFVEPYRAYVRNISKTCKAAKVPFWTVDGSTSVPPVSKVKRTSPQQGNNSNIYDGDLWFAGAPSKAWRWEKQTDAVRKQHVYGVVRDQALEAPPLEHKLPPNFFLQAAPEGEISRKILGFVPSKWKDPSVSAPGQRPWTVQELCDIPDCKAWALKWKGADTTVPPCPQTHGSATSAKIRWKNFLKNGGLKQYASTRNDIKRPHCVSRVSCYLNLGILSIFEVLADVWEAQSTKGYAKGCGKFLDEVVKWREGSYVHVFCHPNYHTAKVLPPWAIRYLKSVRTSSKNQGGYDYRELESAATRDETWNAMQDYLVETGELHNNARMTWGKTVVHWQAIRVSPEESLWQLCCLNDRFALDGLSPPSYGGVLWCFGWQDKPGSNFSVTEKWAHRYRTGPSGFSEAKDQLRRSSDASNGKDGPSQKSVLSFVTQKRAGAESGRDKSTTTPATKSKKARLQETPESSPKGSILSYFGAKAGAMRQIG